MGGGLPHGEHDSSHSRAHLGEGAVREIWDPGTSTQRPRHSVHLSPDEGSLPGPGHRGHHHARLQSQVQPCRTSSQGSWQATASLRGRPSAGLGGLLTGLPAGHENNPERQHRVLSVRHGVREGGQLALGRHLRAAVEGPEVSHPTRKCSEDATGNCLQDGQRAAAESHLSCSTTLQEAAQS